MALLPFQYNLRSLFVRKSTTMLTICSTGATVAVLAGVLSLQQGFATTFVERGREDLAVFMRPGAVAEGESSIRRDLTEILIKGTPEIALNAKGQPLASAELYAAILYAKIGGGDTNVPIRGVQPMTFEIHGDEFKIAEGRNLTAGSDEVIVGRSLVERIKDCRLDATFTINTTPFRVVGIFESKGAYQSEIWGDGERMLKALQRRSYNRVIGVLKDPKTIEALSERLKKDKQVPAKVLSEKTYLSNQTGTLSALFIILGSFLSFIMGIAAVFTGTNSMLSALAGRVHEIGILLSMGFRPFAIFVAFLLESVLIGLLGGIVGCLLVLPLSGVQTGTTNFQTFSEVVFAFRMTPTVLVTAVLFAMFLGLVGGAVPAWKASRLRPTEALRRG
jgi:putative ABC transport system permease protein